jgi:hypothetical protein
LHLTYKKETFFSQKCLFGTKKKKEHYPKASDIKKVTTGSRFEKVAANVAVVYSNPTKSVY